MEELYPSMDWILSHPAYKSWSQLASPSILLLRKKRGLDVKALHDPLLRLFNVQFSPAIVTASFFSSVLHVYQNSSNALIASLLMQLLYKRPTLFSNMQSLYNASKTTPKWTEQQLWTLLRALIYRVRDQQIILVVHALYDSGTDQDSLLGNLTSMLEAIEANFKIVITYEGEQDLIANLPRIVFEIDLDNVDISDHLNSYFGKVLASLIKSYPVIKAFEQKILERFNDPSATYSIWARSMLSCLKMTRNLSTPREFEDELKSLTARASGTRAFDEPNKIYIDLMYRPLPHQRSWADRVLIWVSCACRPLKLRELASALALEFGAISDEDFPRDIESDLARTLVGLIEVNDDEVRVVHPAVRGLLNIQDDKTAWGQAHHLVYEDCMSVLLHMYQAPGAMNIKNHDEVTRTFKLEQSSAYDLLEYAKSYWHIHYLHAQNFDTDNDVTGLLNKLEKMPLYMEEQIQKTFGDMSAEFAIDQLKDYRLWMCSYLGLTGGVKALIKLPYQPHEVDLSAGLVVAAQEGHMSVVSELVDSRPSTSSAIQAAILKASIHGHNQILSILVQLANDGFIRDKASELLQHAVVHNNTQILQFLLRFCKGKVSLEQDILTSLHMASVHGYSSVVKLLLTVEDAIMSINGTDGKNTTALHLAAENGSLETVKVLLSKNAAVELSNSEGLVPLHLASQNGHVEVVKLLLDYGANSDIRTTKNDSTALHYAAWKGNYAVAKVLLAAGVDVNAQNNAKKSPAHFAALTGRENILQLFLGDSEKTTSVESIAKGLHSRHMDGLIAVKIDLNSIDENGYTPLMLATSKGFEEVAHHIIQCGADINLKNGSSHTALDIASGGGYIAIVGTLLARGADTNTRDSKSRSPLHLASKYGHHLIVLLLLAKEANTQAKDSKHKTPLHLACSHGHDSIVKALLRHAPNLHTLDDMPDWIPLEKIVQRKSKGIVELVLTHFGFDSYKIFGRALSESLIIASGNGQDEVVELLLDAGAKIDYQDRSGNTALQLAAFCSQFKTVFLLLARRANIELKDINGNTALSDAARNGSLQVLKLLLSARADKETKNRRKDTPLLLAAKADRHENMRLLLESGAEMFYDDPEFDSFLQFSVANFSSTIIECLIKYTTDLDLASQLRRSLLHTAVYYRKVETVGLLLGKKADINQISPKRGTALQVAVDDSNLEMVRFLLDQEARVNEGEIPFPTALHTVVHHATRRPERREDVDIVHLLIEHGGDISKVDIQGRLSIHLAATGASISLITELTGHQEYLNCRDHQGRTPLHFAAAGCNYHVLRHLLKQAGVDCNAQDEDGWTPLHWACREAPSNVIRLLLRKGARPSVSIKDYHDG